jgi:tryptophan-rich sensory protein
MLAGLEIIVLWLMIYETYFSFLKLINRWLFIHTVFGLGKFFAMVLLNASIGWLNK